MALRLRPPCRSSSSDLMKRKNRRVWGAGSEALTHRDQGSLGFPPPPPRAGRVEDCPAPEEARPAPRAGLEGRGGCEAWPLRGGPGPRGLWAACLAVPRSGWQGWGCGHGSWGMWPCCGLGAAAAAAGGLEPLLSSTQRRGCQVAGSPLQMCVRWHLSGAGGEAGPGEVPAVVTLGGGFPAAVGGGPVGSWPLN